jgi:hypothetical protein
LFLTLIDVGRDCWPFAVFRAFLYSPIFLPNNVKELLNNIPQSYSSLRRKPTLQVATTSLWPVVQTEPGEELERNENFPTGVNYWWWIFRFKMGAF